MEIATQIDTHAVIGGQAPKAFKMAETASFFTVLSDTLYSNKKLAVVREVLCNAWDEHIHTGQQNRAVVVTLTDTELSIQDFGRGIPDDMIVENYCTYGASTKADDPNQTGGFGLGSKAPFAYTSHFTVVSRHKGYRTIYAVSRGSSETQGRPDIRTVVSVPDLETGITVTIPLMSKEDRKDFSNLIQTIARNGEMKVKLNEQTIDVPDLKFGHEKGYTILPEGILKAGAVSVRYGSAIYPVDMNHQDLKAVFKNTLLTKLERAKAHIVIFAKPGAVGPAPSREALSYSETTITTIRSTMERIFADLSTASNQSVDAILKENFKGIRRRFFEKDYPDLCEYHTTEIAIYKAVSSYRSFDRMATSDVDISRLAILLSGVTVDSTKLAIIALRCALKSKDPSFKDYKGRMRHALRHLLENEKHGRGRGRWENGKWSQRIIRDIFGGTRGWVHGNRHWLLPLMPFRTQITDRVFKNDRYHGFSKVALTANSFPVAIKRILVVDSKAHYMRWRNREFTRIAAEFVAAGKKPDPYWIEDEFGRTAHQMLIIRKIKGDDPVAQMIAARFGVALETAKMEPVEKPIVETKLYSAHGLRVVHSGGLRRFALGGAERVSLPFKHMLECKTGAEKTAIYPNAFRNCSISEILAIYPEVGIVISAAERDRALKNHIEPLQNVIASDLASGVKNRVFAEWAYALEKLQHPGHFQNSRSARHLREWLKNFEILRLMMPWLPKLTPDATKLLSIFRAVEYINDEAVIATIGEILEAGKKITLAKHRDINLSRGYIEGMFPGISLITEHAGVDEHLVDLLKHLKTRGVREQKQGATK